ncbi:unnamed protein product, partial [Phaeothamnion confervicola]
MRSVLKGIWLPFEWAFFAAGKLVLSLWWTFTKAVPGAWGWIRGQEKESPTHGNAGFASMKQLAADGHATPGGFLYGIQDKKRVFGKLEACTHFFGKRGEGKSQTMGANLSYMTTLPTKPDILINDPA